METSHDELDGFKMMVNEFEGMALDIFDACHDPDKEKMLAKVRQAFTVLKEQIGTFSTEDELETLMTGLQRQP